MNFEEIRDALFSALDEQQAADEAAAKENYKLGQQKLMYTNDARGSLYSGQPTWERAQLAANNIVNLADIQQKALNQRLSIWDKITSTMDQINSYNKAAAALSRASGSTTANTADTQSFLDLYNSLNEE